MNKEIEEIIEYFRNDIKWLEEELKNPHYLGNYITIRDKEYEYLKQLLDYITNLQEENKRLNEIVENLTTMTVCGDRKQIKNTAQYKLEIAQDRIDKVIEYIENEYIKRAKSGIEDRTLYANDVKNIVDMLRGEDNGR